MKGHIDPEEIISAADLREGAALPPIDKWQPDKCIDIDIKITRDGSWYHEGEEIKRLQLIKLFASILRREDDGQYYLVTPQEKYRIQVEDVPFVAVTVLEKGEDLVFATNVADSVVLNEDHPLWVDLDSDGQPLPYINVRDRLNALISRSTFYQLVDMGVKKISGNQKTLVLQSGGKEFLLGER